jgi:hypothetical protein
MVEMQELGVGHIVNVFLGFMLMVEKYAVRI